MDSVLCPHIDFKQLEAWAVDHYTCLGYAGRQLEVHVNLLPNF